MKPTKITEQNEVLSYEQGAITFLLNNDKTVEIEFSAGSVFERGSSSVGISDHYEIRFVSITSKEFFNEEGEAIEEEELLHAEDAIKNYIEENDYSEDYSNNNFN